MEIKSRAEAKKAGENTYFTGEPCKNGHVNKRYVQSGTCAGCIRAANGLNDDPIKDARRAAAVNLVQVKIRCFDADLELIKATAWAFGVMRYPSLMMGDVYPGLLPVGDTGGGQALRKYNVHVDDVEALRKIANDSIAARSNGAGEAARARIVGALLALPIEKAPA
jgi:hypothetical protein